MTTYTVTRLLQTKLWKPPSVEQALQVFDGVMLSDGGIVRPASPWFQITLSGKEHMDWLYYIESALVVLGVELCSSYPKVVQAFNRCTGMYHDYYRLITRESEFITEQRIRWYSSGRKEVPIDFTFTPIVLANELMGDGSSNWNNGNHDYGIYIDLCTQSFNLESIELLEYELKRVGLTHLSRNHRPTQCKPGIALRVLGTSAAEFMELVEPYILPSYRYKVKKPGLRQRVPAACNTL